MILAVLLDFFCMLGSAAHRQQGTHMDLHDQRIACLRMAIDLGCKPDTAIRVASDLMTFVTSGAPTSAAQTTAEEAAPDRIAACGTALPLSETADLAAATVAAVAPEPGATEPESAAAAVVEQIATADVAVPVPQQSVSEVA